MKKLEEYVKSIPDFPEKGIIFRDVTSVLQDAIDLKRLDYGSWLGLLIVAAINIILGVVLIYNPFKAAILLFRVLGVVLILSGAGDCFSTIYFARKLRRFKQEQDALDSTFEEIHPEE